MQKSKQIGKFRKIIATLVFMEAKELYDELKRRLTLEVSDEEKRAMIRWLLEDRLSLSSMDIQTNKLVPASPNEFADVIRRLNNEEPLQYVLGYTEFYGRKFQVNPTVLIPRPETELLVKFVVDTLGKASGGQLVDLGTGSGCIAITLALELPGFLVAATDVDTRSLEVAGQNAKRLKADIEFLQHDILTQRIPFHQLDAVISNPPYIRQGEAKTLARNISYEPAHALFVPDVDPLVFHRTLSEKAVAALKPGGLLAIEINEKLGSESARAIQECGFSAVAIVKDLDNRDRFVTARSPIG